MVNMTNQMYPESKMEFIVSVCDPSELAGVDMNETS